MNIEAFPAPFISYILVAVSLCSAHISPFLLNLIEINPLCQPKQRAPSVREETQLHREGE